MTMKRIGIVSPDPEEKTQGLEKFCHMLRTALNSRGFDAAVIDLKADTRDYDLIVTNGIFGPWRVEPPRLHVYHGTAPKQLAIRDTTVSRRWKMKALADKSAREFRAGLGASRVAVSPSVQKELRRYYRFSSGVVLNGVNTDAFKPRDQQSARERMGLAPSGKFALFAGRPEARKLPEYAIAAAKATGHQLLLAAGKPYPGMEWIGRLSEEDLALAMAAVDVAYLPSQYEATPLTVIEALATETPVVTTRVGWMPSLIDEVPSFANYAPDHRSIDAFVAAAEFQARNADHSRETTRQVAAFVRQTVSLDCFADDWALAVQAAL